MLCIPVLAMAQRSAVAVRATIVEQGNDAPMEYATLVLEDVNNPENVNGGLSDLKGRVKVDITPGTYNIRVAYLSFKPMC